MAFVVFARFVHVLTIAVISFEFVNYFAEKPPRLGKWRAERAHQTGRVIYVIFETDTRAITLAHPLLAVWLNVLLCSFDGDCLHGPTSLSSCITSLSLTFSAEWANVISH
uniref:Secreted protein n=1 Tax=Steinernema glaseri TaxID=37863 RepID=A0A1I7Z4N2_9BILA